MGRGTSDGHVFLKENGEYYHPIPTGHLAERTGKDISSLPGLQKKKASGRRSKKPSGSPFAGDSTRERLDDKVSAEDSGTVVEEHIEDVDTVPSKTTAMNMTTIKWKRQ